MKGRNMIQNEDNSVSAYVPIEEKIMNRDSDTCTMKANE